jgi:hypothetical protein
MPKPMFKVKCGLSPQDKIYYSKEKQKKRKRLIHAGEEKMQGCSAAELCITLAFL